MPTSAAENFGWATAELANDVPSSAPISYSANGQEYVAIVVGPGRLQSSSYNALVPEIKAPPEQGAAIWVFAL